MDIAKEIPELSWGSFIRVHSTEKSREIFLCGKRPPKERICSRSGYVYRILITYLPAFRKDIEKYTGYVEPVCFASKERLDFVKQHFEFEEPSAKLQSGNATRYSQTVNILKALMNKNNKDLNRLLDSSDNRTYPKRSKGALKTMNSTLKT